MYREVDSILNSRINLLKENKVSKLHHHYLLVLRNNIRMHNNLPNPYFGLTVSGSWTRTSLASSLVISQETDSAMSRLLVPGTR